MIPVNRNHAAAESCAHHSVKRSYGGSQQADKKPLQPEGGGGFKPIVGFVLPIKTEHETHTSLSDGMAFPR